MADVAPADELSQSAKETRSLLRRRKRQVAEAVLSGEETTVAELAAIAKLELRLENMTTFERLRDLTREPAPGSERPVVPPRRRDSRGRFTKPAQG